MGTQLTPDGIKFNGYEKTQKKPICTVAGIEPDNDGNISLNLSSINDQISDLDDELFILEQVPSKTFVLSQSTTSVDEGDPITITLTTTNVFNGGRIPYTITPNGVDLNNDFTSTVASTGNFEIQNNIATLTLTLREDYVTESSSESFTLTLGAGDNPSVTVNINDTSQDPTYSLAPQYSSIDEGTPLTINVSTTNVPSGTTLYWSVSQPNDFSVDSGSFQVTGTATSSTGSFTVTPTNDETTEGTETFTVSISSEVNGSSVAATSPITINDTSKDPENYTLIPTVDGTITNVVSEGQTVVIKIETIGVANFTQIPYTITPNNIDLAEDYTYHDVLTTAGNNKPWPEVPTNGVFMVANNQDTVSFTLKSDELTEPIPESFTLTLNAGNNPSVTINVSDTSQAPVGYTNYQVLTSNGSFTVPSGVSRIKIHATGSGGYFSILNQGPYAPPFPVSHGGTGILEIDVTPQSVVNCQIYNGDMMLAAPAHPSLTTVTIAGKSGSLICNGGEPTIWVTAQGGPQGVEGGGATNTITSGLVSFEEYVGYGSTNLTTKYWDDVKPRSDFGISTTGPSNNFTVGSPYIYPGGPMTWGVVVIEW